MNSEFSPHSSVAEVEEEFRRLRKSTIAEYERELEQFRVEEAAMAERGRRYSEATKRMLRENGVDDKKLFRSLAKTWDEEQKELEDFLSEARPRLMEADPQLEERAREEATRALFLDGSGWSEAHLIGGDLLAPNEESIGGLEGKVGNPGTWLYQKKAKEVKIKDVSTGSGSGCVGRPVPVPVKFDWWYHWNPPKKGKYLFWPMVDYHGFYVIKADDGCFSCKRADISASIGIKVHQHWWRGVSGVSIVNLGSQHIDKSSLLHDKKSWKFYEYLDTSHIIVRARVSLCAQAKGSGSYAEVNFKDGKSAHVSAPIVLVSG